MDLENKFSYHFLEGLTPLDMEFTQGNEQVYIPQKELGVIVLLESAGMLYERYDHRISRKILLLVTSPCKMYLFFALHF